MPKYLENKGSNKKENEGRGEFRSSYSYIYKTPLIAELSFHYNMCC